MKVLSETGKWLQVAGLVASLTVGTIAAPAGRMTGVQEIASAASKSVKSLSLSVSKASISVGDTLTLKVTVNPESAKAKWSSSKKAVATVSAKGVVKAKKAGSTQITVKAGKKKAICKVTVKAASMPAANIEPAASALPSESPLSDSTPRVIDANEMLDKWTEGATAKKELVSYMETVTKEDSADYIPKEDRIAVFDLDGTLFCETDPNYFDYTLLRYRVLDDPEYKDQASDFEKEVALKIDDQNKNGTSYAGLEVDHGKAVASAFKGMTLKEFNDYIQEFKKQDMPGYTGMKRGEGFYQPMLQIVNYLKANDFTVYIVSGTDRFIVRGIADGSPLGLPKRQIIGSDVSLVAPDQGDTEGLKYTYDDNDKLVLGGEFLIKNLKMNKVTVIMQEIGQKPVLSFGNSSGDASMAEFVTSDNPYKSLAFMLCCDDTERENGNIKKADEMKSMCQEFDWVPVSMKDDWKTIYGDGVERFYLSGSWQDEVSQRASMDVTKNSDGSYDIMVHWGASAWESAIWEIHGTYDEASGTLSYQDGKYYVHAVDENDQETIYGEETTTGAFIREDGKLRWKDSKNSEEGLFVKE